MNHIVFLLLVNSLGQQWGARLALSHVHRSCVMPNRFVLERVTTKIGLITHIYLNAVRFLSKKIRFTGKPYQRSREYQCVVLVSEYIKYMKVINQTVVHVLVNMTGQWWRARLAEWHVHLSCVMPNSVCT